MLVGGLVELGRGEWARSCASLDQPAAHQLLERLPFQPYKNRACLCSENLRWWRADGATPAYEVGSTNRCQRSAPRTLSSQLALPTGAPQSNLKQGVPKSNSILIKSKFVFNKIEIVFIKIDFVFIKMGALSCFVTKAFVIAI